MGERKKSGYRWTDEQVDILRSMWGEVRDSVIAQKIGRSVSSVRFKAGDLGLRDEKGRRTGSRPGRAVRPWTHEEDLILKSNVGYLSIFELMEKLPGRNRFAIERRCYELGFSPTQGTYTRLQVERDTGYDWRQIKRARDATGQKWKRYGDRKYMITEDQRDEIIEYLKNEKRRWSLHYGLDGCVRCGSNGEGGSERHSGDGLCKRCYDLRRYERSFIVSSINRGNYEILNEEKWRELRSSNNDNENGARHTS